MSVLVVGSVALDSIETPRGRAPDVVGGSATHFAVAASLFAPVRLVGVVGDDFPEEYMALLRARDIDLAGLEVVSGGRTFRWSGRYSQDMNSRETLSVELNVFADFQPRIPEAFRDTGFVFLANGSPVTQASVLGQIRRPRFVMADTMDLWIQNARADLLALLARLDGLILNDEEARMLTGEPGILAAARATLALGPRYVIVKKGEHGSLLLSRDRIFILPAFPVEDLVDPTGAGDSYAGGVMGSLARAGACEFEDLRRAIVDGTVVASFNVGGFALDRTRKLTREEFEARRAAFIEMVRPE